MRETELPATPTRPDVLYEPTDIDGRRVIATGGTFLLIIWISGVFVYILYGYLMHSRSKVGAPPSTRAASRILAPPEPRLQSDPTAQLQLLRAKEDAQLNNYRWVDKQKGIVSIPIERAIELTAQRGIPSLRSTLKVCDKQSPSWQAGAGGIADPMMICPPKAGTRETGLEGKVEPEPR